VAQGDPAGPRRRASAASPPTWRASGARTSRRTSASTPTTATPSSCGSLLEDLDIQGATIVVHDWGGPIGLRLAVEQAQRIERIVILDTGLFTGHQHMSDAWLAFRDFVERTEDLPVGFLVRGGCKNDPGDEVIAAYDAPYRIRRRRPERAPSRC
jgi:pimeloyl-ACP methyl ester carboxylesterase